MKVIDLEEAKSNLDRYAQECQLSPVVVTVGGKPVFELILVRTEDPNFLDRLLESNREFRALAEERRKESDSCRVSSLEEVRQRLEKE